MSFLGRLNPLAGHPVSASGEVTTDSGTVQNKDAYVKESAGFSLKSSSVEPAADKIVEPGELTFEEDTSGGLGRHLGLFSTTFLMYVPSPF